MQTTEEKIANHHIARTALHFRELVDAGAKLDNDELAIALACLDIIDMDLHGYDNE